MITLSKSLFGVSLSEPDINDTAMSVIYGICMYVCMYVWYVRHLRATS